MPSRSVRRRRHKQADRLLDWIAGLSPNQRRAVGLCDLKRWRAEAHRRADDLGAPTAWSLAAEARPVALALDPSGELACDLDRTVAEAVATAAGRHLVRGSRPASDRARVSHL